MLAGLGMVDEVIEKGYVEPLSASGTASRKSSSPSSTSAFSRTRRPTRSPCNASSTSSPAWRCAGSRDYPNVTVEFSGRVTSLEHFADRVEIVVDSAEGIRRSQQLSDRQ